MQMTGAAVVATRFNPADYLELTKPRITLLVSLTAYVGFAVGSGDRLVWSLLLPVLLGTALVAAGASTLNMLLERRTDALMQRTRQRPLPAGRLRPGEVLGWGLALTGLGIGTLLWLANPLAAAVALTTWLTYLFCYTPLKTRTSLATVVGAVPGALPPVIGWVAARGQLDPGAFILFAILFLWQIPHFLAIAWIFREDYARGGLPMLPVVDPEGSITGRQAVGNSLALLLVSVLPTVTGLAGVLYLWAAIVMGMGLVAVSLWVARARSLKSARGLFVGSIVYLTLLCVVLVVDRIPH